MYIVDVRYRAMDRLLGSIVVADIDNLFTLAYILDNSSIVIEYMVSKGVDCICLPSDFSFGGMKKWVSRFSYRE